MKNQEPNKPTGTLEELFRHHLSEAAVPPRQQVWDQIDNALLLAQNQAYRRRLRAARWVAAASLLLATLAGTGWWTRRDFQPAPTVTVATPVPGSAAREARPASGVGAAALPGTPAPRAGEAIAAAPAAAYPAAGVANQDQALVGSTLPTMQGAPTLAQRAPGGRPLTPTGELRADDQTSASSAGGPLASVVPAWVARRGRAREPRALLAVRAGAGALGLPANSNGRPAAWPTPAATLSTAPIAATASAATASMEAASTVPGILAAGQEPAWGLRPLAGTPTALAVAPAGALPAPLATLVLPTAPEEAPAPGAAPRWRLGLTYVAGLFQPNLNFSRAGIAAAYDYNPALGINSPALSEAAAAEYQQQQRAGLSQRLRLQASRHLSGAWSVATGLEVAQQESRSATSFIFTGEQVPDLSQRLTGGVRQATTARFRTAGLPLELRYANPSKSGVSLYGRVGAVVSALLTSRTTVENEPEATRTYTLLSGSTPYRRVLGTVRGAVGVRLRPAGHAYTLSLGPVAEIGMWSLNRQPAQSFLGQSRPHSFGLEAAVEFGKGRPKL